MAIGSIFENNRTQAVRLPVGTRFPAEVKKVKVRICGCDRVLSPIDRTWDSFFLSGDNEEIDIERGDQGVQREREPIE